MVNLRLYFYSLLVILFAFPTISPTSLYAQDESAEEIASEVMSLKGKDAKDLSKDAYIMRNTDRSEMDNYKVLTLGDVLEQGLRQNYDQLIRNHQKKLLDLGFKDSYASFWYPNVDLNLTTSTYRLGELFDGNDDLIGKIVRIKIFSSNRNSLFGEVLAQSKKKVA